VLPVTKIRRNLAADSGGLTYPHDFQGLQRQETCCLTAPDPQLPDDDCKGYGGFMITKLPFETLAWRSPRRQSLVVRPDSGGNAPLD